MVLPVVRLFGVSLATSIAAAMGTGSVAIAATTMGVDALTSFGAVHATVAYTRIADVNGDFAIARRTITRGLPVLVLGDYRGGRPRTIDFSGDSGNVVGNLRWSSWTTSQATASGKSIVQGCVPDCATGAQILVPTSIALRDPIDGYFTRIIERRDGQTETFISTPNQSRGNWPRAQRTPSPDGPVVSLEGYWGDIDTGAYAEAWAYLGVAGETKAAFVQGEQEAGPANIELLGRLTGISGSHARVDVSRLVTHDQQYGCRSWSGYYEMVKSDGKWLIANARISPKAC